MMSAMPTSCSMLRMAADSFPRMSASLDEGNRSPSARLTPRPCPWAVTARWPRMNTVSSSVLLTSTVSRHGVARPWPTNGAVGGGAAGETFADVRTGLRAQVQHLKAYASTDGLNNACVDKRFQYVSRGTARYVEWLAIPQNPYGKGWAADADYGTKLLRIMDSL